MQICYCKTIKKNDYFIGKTRINCENYLKNDSFTKYDYYKISNKVIDFIIKNKISELPINLEQIIYKNGWFLISYTDAKKHLKFIDKTYYLNNSGFTLFLNNQYYIFIDDSLLIQGQRFTIAHEIGHIVLSHFIFDSETREKQANMFAARLLMPMCVLHECNVKSPSEIAGICDVSGVAAKYRFDRLEILRVRNKFYTNNKEILLYKAFKKFIKRVNRGK